MQSIIENVTRQAAQIAEATGRQREQSIEIVGLIGKILMEAEDLKNSAHNDEFGHGFLHCRSTSIAAGIGKI